MRLGTLATGYPVPRQGQDYILYYKYNNHWVSRH